MIVYLSALRTHSSALDGTATSAAIFRSGGFVVRQEGAGQQRCPADATMGERQAGRQEPNGKRAFCHGAEGKASRCQ